VKLKFELQQAMDLGNLVVQRERLKRSQMHLVGAVWDTRNRYAKLKRKFSDISSKDDEDLLIDRERVAKKSKNAEER
jgi:enhancer of polycomb-like protein